MRVAVTMAKGIGNGFPMAAVVTTPEIAKSLQHALHFNTFGGSPLACAVASTVLNVRKRRESSYCRSKSLLLNQLFAVNITAAKPGIS